MLFWAGWQRAIAHLGFNELVSLVENAFDRGWIDRGELSPRDFHDTPRAARHVAEPTAVFDAHIREGRRLDNAVRHLSRWAAFRPEEDRLPRPAMAAKVPVRGRPIHQPNRDVGRNDPCPCGSGKKFKKCCLGKAL